MALTGDEKVIRRRVVARAVVLLRDHLHLTQPRFARLLDEEADVIAVSRWERGIALPHPSTRENLAEIARKNGRKDLETVFRDPVVNWKAVLPGNAQYLSDLITLLEICAINQHIAGTNDPEEDLYFQALASIASQIRDRIATRVKETGIPVLLVTDAQRHLWFGMMDELGITQSKKRQRKGKRNGQGEKTR